MNPGVHRVAAARLRLIVASTASRRLEQALAELARSPLLLLGQPAGGPVAAALAWSGGSLFASVLLSMVLFRRRTA